MSRWQCDACAEAEGSSGAPCKLESNMLPENGPTLCPVTGEEAEWTMKESEKIIECDTLAFFDYDMT